MSRDRPCWRRCGGEDDGLGYANFPGDGDLFFSSRYIIDISDPLHCGCWLSGGCSLKVSSSNCGDHFGKSDLGSRGRRKTRYKAKRKPWKDSDGSYKGVDVNVLFAALL